jgi:hypothetical protein
MRLSREFFADMLQAVMQEKWLHCGNVAAIRRATVDDGALSSLSLQYMLQC